jgi:hypothetical protein
MPLIRKQLQQDDLMQRMAERSPIAFRLWVVIVFVVLAVVMGVGGFVHQWSDGNNHGFCVRPNHCDRNIPSNARTIAFEGSDNHSRDSFALATHGDGRRILVRCELPFSWLRWARLHWIIQCFRQRTAPRRRTDSDSLPKRRSEPERCIGELLVLRVRVRRDRIKITARSARSINVTSPFHS